MTMPMTGAVVRWGGVVHDGLQKVSDTSTTKQGAIAGIPLNANIVSLVDRLQPPCSDGMVVADKNNVVGAGAGSPFNPNRQFADPNVPVAVKDDRGATAVPTPRGGGVRQADSKAHQEFAYIICAGTKVGFPKKSYVIISRPDGERLTSIPITPVKTIEYARQSDTSPEQLFFTLITDRRRPFAKGSTVTVEWNGKSIPLLVDQLEAARANTAEKRKEIDSLQNKVDSRKQKSDELSGKINRLNDGLTKPWQGAKKGATAGAVGSLAAAGWRGTTVGALLGKGVDAVRGALGWLFDKIHLHLAQRKYYKNNEKLAKAQQALKRLKYGDAKACLAILAQMSTELWERNSSNPEDRIPGNLVRVDYRSKDGSPKAVYCFGWGEDTVLVPKGEAAELPQLPP